MKVTEKEIKEFQKFTTKFRKTIPEQYNQIELADKLLDPKIDFLISISNRSDGKTFNYVSYFMKLAIDLGIRFTMVARHYTLRKAYVELIFKIAEELKHFQRDQLFTTRNDDYTTIYYGEDPICIVTDLNNATDLKYHSNMLKDYPIIVYDEFLALESDYLPDEWDKLKTIYESIDRNHGNIDYLKIPKIVLLGNAVNFSSPLLANLNIFEKLQYHKINTARQYNNIYLEMRRNDNSNEKRNTRAFSSDNDAMTTGEFDFNNYNLADDNLRNHIAKNGNYFHIKMRDYFAKIMYNINDYTTNIKIVPTCDNYTFCTEVSDVKDNARYLKTSKYYNERNPKRYYHKSNLYFDNAYSKQFILTDPQFIELDINKCVRTHITQERMISGNYAREFERHEKMYNDNYIERTKRNLVKRFH